jgi:hypothetical protein
MSSTCTHIDAVGQVAPPSDVCETCIAIGGEWVNLRQCLTCAVTLCCDSSPNQHMTGHNGATSHPVMRSAMPDQDWSWCFVDQAMLRETPEGWETFDPFLEAGSSMVGEYLAAGGSPDPAPDFVNEHGFPLGDWFAFVREARENGELEPRDAARLEAIPGWRW